jgi:hypothetical protein
MKTTANQKPKKKGFFSTLWESMTKTGGCCGGGGDCCGASPQSIRPKVTSEQNQPTQIRREPDEI